MCQDSAADNCWCFSKVIGKRVNRGHIRVESLNMSSSDDFDGFGCTNIDTKLRENDYTFLVYRGVTSPKIKTIFEEKKSRRRR